MMTLTNGASAVECRCARWGLPTRIVYGIERAEREVRQTGSAATCASGPDARRPRPGVGIPTIWGAGLQSGWQYFSLTLHRRVAVWRLPMGRRNASAIALATYREGRYSTLDGAGSHCA